MTPHGIPQKEKILKNTVSRKHNGYVILGWGHVVILVSLLPTDAATNCDQGHEALRSLNACFRLVPFTREISKTLSLHETPGHTQIWARLRTLFRHTAWSTVLVLPYIHLPGPLKDSPRGQYCVVNVAVQKAVRPRLQRKEGDFVERGYMLLLKGWRRISAQMEIILK